MNPSGESRFNQARIEWAIRLRYSPMPELNTKWVAANLNAFRIGELRVIGKMWEIMMERDGELAVNADKRAGDLAGMEWKIVSDGSAEGEEHAAALNYFYRNLRVTRALDQDVAGGVSELLLVKNNDPKFDPQNTEETATFWPQAQKTMFRKLWGISCRSVSRKISSEI